MKPSPRPSRSTRYAHMHDDSNEFVIMLPDLQILRLIARSVLLAAAILSFPWLRAIFPFDADAAASATSAAPPSAKPKWVDSPLSLRLLISDLKREGLFNSELRNVFLGDPGFRSPFLKKNGLDLAKSEFERRIVQDGSVDFVFGADGLDGLGFGFVDRVLKVGGIVAVRLVSDPGRMFRLPDNYRMVYIRRFRSTIVGMKKISHGNVGEIKDGFGGRKLLCVAKSKKKRMYVPKLEHFFEKNGGLGFIKVKEKEFVVMKEMKKGIIK